MPISLDVLAAGAVHGYLDEAHRSLRNLDYYFRCRFAPAKTVAEKIRNGDPFDIAISSLNSVEKLAADGLLDHATIRRIGITDLTSCVRSGIRPLRLANEAALREMLIGATSIYLPDPKQSTAGGHMMRVIDELALPPTVGGKVKTFANGASTLQALSESADRFAVGFTQRSEIIGVTGISIGDPLPAKYALATAYVAAVNVTASNASLARNFIAHLSDPEQQTLLRQFGFNS